MSLVTPPSELEPADLARRRDEANEFLLGRINYERTATVPYSQRELKLDRMRQLLTHLGNPDAGLPIVHVAGTKGKGSTSAMITAMLHAAGYDAGLFSSPHLECVEERFAVNGLPCSSAEFVALVDRLKPMVQLMDAEAERTGDHSLSPTYFELTTALALMHFAERKVDLAVMEVGMGGRLDSTNVCQPVVTVITSISLDHTKQLGDTVEAIAAEKAGIIKPGVPVLCGPLTAGPRRVIAEQARRHGCRLLESGRDFTHRYRPARGLDHQAAFSRLDFDEHATEAFGPLHELPLGLLGEHQAENAALALATIAELRRQNWLVSTEAVREGLSSVRLAGRVEVVSRHPTIVFDVAHNVASAQALVRVLEESFAGTERLLLLAATRDKDVLGIVRTLLPHFARCVVTEYQDNPRAVPVERLAEIVAEEMRRLGRGSERLLQFDCPLEAWRTARELARPEELLCVTGSFFIVAELRRAWLADAAPTPAGAPTQTAGPHTPPGSNSNK
jgi:dihydrofolate synthase/folylpolyglutamate synthase